MPKIKAEIEVPEYCWEFHTGVGCLFGRDNFCEIFKKKLRTGLYKTSRCKDCKQSEVK